MIVANRYLALRGAAVASSLDIALILDWELEGIPLTAALTGIENAFENMAPDKPRSLRACLPYVLIAAREMATTATGDATQISSNDEAAFDIEKKLERRIEIWQAADDEERARAITQARALLASDLGRMTAEAAELTIKNLAMRILASRALNLETTNSGRS